MKRAESRLGQKYLTNEGYTVEVVGYRNNQDCDIKILDENGHILKNRHFKDVVEGRVKNPYHLAVYGKGCIGVGSNERGRAYTAWKKVLERCYSKEYHIKKPTYKDVTVCKEWHNFQNFAQWYNENWKEYMERWHIDKDILIKGNKVYSPETCCFVPIEVNSLLTKSDTTRGEHPIGVSFKKDKFLAQISSKRENVSNYIGLFDTKEEAFQAYKTAKEQYIKEVADKWKDQIDPRVYEALYNYQVEITD